MNISISSYSFHGLLSEGRMDVFGFLESCKYRYGLSAVEIWNGTMGGNTDEDYLRKVRSALDERELTLACLCVDGPHVWVDDPPSGRPTTSWPCGICGRRRFSAPARCGWTWAGPATP